MINESKTKPVSEAERKQRPEFPRGFEIYQDADNGEYMLSLDHVRFPLGKVRKMLAWLEDANAIEPAGKGGEDATIASDLVRKQMSKLATFLGTYTNTGFGDNEHTRKMYDAAVEFVSDTVDAARRLRSAPPSDDETLQSLELLLEQARAELADAEGLLTQMVEAHPFGMATLMSKEFLARRGGK